ncbi:MAG: enoyl-CoA hydratase/isomerase family protein [Halioglobus sp.]
MSRLLVEKFGAVWVAKFHNPPHSYMDPQTEKALSEFLDEVEANEEVRVVVLTGSEPGVFIRHYDVAVLLGNSEAMSAKGMTFTLDRPVPETLIHKSLARIESSPVPFIAAINGSAMGGGFELTLACDIRLVQEGDYDLGLPEVNIGLLAGAGGTQRLPRLIGQSRALAMELCGRTISPRQAVEFGLALECVEDDVLARALVLAEQLVGKSAQALAHIKYLVRGSTQWDRDEGLAKERTAFCDLLVKADSRDAMRAMVAGEKNIRNTDD